MKLNYKVFGEGEPLIILHGLMGMLDNWQTQAKMLQDKFQVLSRMMRRQQDIDTMSGRPTSKKKQPSSPF